MEKDLQGLREQRTSLQLQQETQSASLGCLGYPVPFCSIGFNPSRVSRKVIVPFLSDPIGSELCIPGPGKGQVGSDWVLNPLLALSQSQNLLIVKQPLKPVHGGPLTPRRGRHIPRGESHSQKEGSWGGDHDQQSLE